MRKAADLPNDVEALKAELVAARALVIEQKIELEKLRFEIACLKRMKYGRSSEQLDTQIAQMQLTLEDLEATLAETPEALRPAPKEAAVKPVRRALPAHLPREDVVHDTACTCPACGGTLRHLGEDVWAATDSDDTTLSLIASVVRTPVGSGNPMSSVVVADCRSVRCSRTHPLEPHRVCGRFSGCTARS
jgi:transposase